MGQPKTREDVELAKIKADLELERAKVELEKAKIGDPNERARLYCRVATVLIVGAFISFCFYHACWALVEIVSKPPWVEIIVAVIGALGPLSFFTWRLAVCLESKVEKTEVEQAVRLESKVEETEVEQAPQIVPPEPPKEGGPT